MKRRIVTIAGLLILLVLIVCIAPLPVKVDQTLTGVYFYNDGRTETETDEIRIKGTYYQYLFRKNKFKGDIQIEGLMNGEEWVLNKAEFMRRDYAEGRCGYVAYYNATQNRMDWLGTFFVQGDFDKVLIFSEDSQTRYFMAPAATREEAVSGANELTKGLYKFQ